MKQVIIFSFQYIWSQYHAFDKAWKYSDVDDGFMQSNSLITSYVHNYHH